MTGKPQTENHIAAATGNAAGAALRRISLARAAPSGRAFEAIATLTELSRRIEVSLEASAEALKNGDNATAQREWLRSAGLMDEMASTADEDFGAQAQDRPSYLRRSAGSEG